MIKDVWIGSQDSASDIDFLKFAKIKSIINCSGMEPIPEIAKAYKKYGIDYYTLSKIRDGRVVDFLADERFRIGRFTPEDFYSWMDKGLSFALKAKKPMQINCHAGINRAGS